MPPSPRNCTQSALRAQLVKVSMRRIEEKKAPQKRNEAKGPGNWKKYL